MAKVDTSDWKEFYLGGENGLFDIVKGKRLTKADMKEGNINFIGSSAENNGVTNHIDNKNNIHEGNLITVSYNGSVGESFYQEDRFVASDDVNVLYPRFELNKYIAWFICPIIRSVGKNYAFINKWKKEDMEKSIIKLPVDNKNKPDWEYMEQYIKKLESSTIELLNRYINASNSNNVKLDIHRWEEYRVGELFPNIIKPYVYHTKDVEEDSCGISYVVRSKFHNGIKYRVKKKDNLRTNPAGVISFGAENATFFYQSEEWCSGRDIYYIDTRELSQYACYFVITCLMSIIDKYSYNFGLFPDLLKEESIKLPVKDGQPDYKYMEQYMRNAEKKAQLNLKCMV